jgi:hypothetical protein
MWLWAVTALAAILFASSAHAAWRFTVDDAFITLRYSRNVAEGLGPTFNASGPHAEGYTSLSWMLALVVPHLLGVDALAVAKGLGIAATLSTLLVAVLWARAEARASGAAPRAAAWAGATAALCFGASPATAIHAVSGMETALFTLLLTAMLASAARVVRDERGERLFVAMALLVGLTRPEGNLAALAAIATVAALLPRGRRLSFGLWATLGWLVPVGAFQVWRRSYYGLPFPLPFYVKLMTPGLLPGWRPVLDYVRATALHLGLLLAPAFVRPPRSLRPALAVVATLLAFFLFPQHLMGYQHRYLAPLDPTMAVLAGVGLARLLTLAARADGPMSQVPEAAMTATAVALVGFGAGFELARGYPDLAGSASYGDGLSRAHERLGRDLLALAVPGGRLAISDAGAVPYRSRWWTLDLIGLNDATIARTGRRDPASVLAQRPDVVVLVSRQPDRFVPAEWSLWELPIFDGCLEDGFVEVGAPRRFADDYWLWVLARVDSAAARGLAGR